MTDSVAIIPARGGSKRLPRKNVKPLLGRPLLAWTVEAAIASGQFREVWVSTDDDAIAAAAAEAGALVHRRPDALGSDTATMVQVCLDLLDRLAAEGREPDTFCCLLATSALRGADDITGARAMLEPGRRDFVMAVTRYWQNPLQALVEDEGGLRSMWPELIDLRPADRPSLWVDAGCTYWAATAAFRQARSFYGPDLVGYPMARLDSVDVDDDEDFRLLEALVRARREE